MPLTLTINGIDGFQSGKWVLHANAVVIDDETLELNATGSTQSSTLTIDNLISNSDYVINGILNGVSGARAGYELLNSSDGVVKSYTSLGGIDSPIVIKTTSDSKKIRIHLTNTVSGKFTFKRPMLNLGSVSAPYEKKRGERMVLPTFREDGTVQLNPKLKRPVVQAKKGLRFNGDGYLQLPSMMMDSIEIECLIDSSQLQADPYFIDPRTGLAGGHITTSGTGGAWSTITVNGTSYLNQGISSYPRDQRLKVKLETTTPFTDDVIFFNAYTGGRQLKGVLYKVTCYLQGVMVANYNFENPLSLVGDRFIPNEKNLIPSFEDNRWQLHQNFKVLGGNVGRLDATSLNQPSYIDLPCAPNKSYLFESSSGLFTVSSRDINNNHISNSLFTVKNGSFVSPNNAYFLRILTYNSTASGSFDFIKPQLYELTGQEGTVVGSPQSLIKQSKRSLYAKR